MPRKAKYVLDIEEAISDVRARVLSHGHELLGEQRTRYSLVDRMLTALDWNLTNPEEVAMEYPRNAGKVDYAFLVPELKNPVMLLEAKGVQARDIDAILEKSDDETCPSDEQWINWSQRDVNQLKGYCRGLRAGFGVLTDGVFWDIYNLNKRGSFEDKRKERISIAHTEVGKGAETLKILHRLNVRKLPL